MLVWFFFVEISLEKSNVTTLKNHKFENVNSNLSTFIYMDSRVNLETHHEFTCFASRRSISWCVNLWKHVNMANSLTHFFPPKIDPWTTVTGNQCNRNMVFQHKKRRSVSVVPKNENWTAIFPEIHHPMVFFQSFREFLVVFFDLEEVDGHLWGWHLRIWLAEWEHLGSATATRPSSVRRPKILMPQLICVGNGWKFWEVMVTNYVSTDFIDLVVANTVFM